MYVILFLVKFRYDMLSWYKYLILNLVFSNLAFWSGNLFLIAHFPDRCLRVSFYSQHCSGTLANTVTPNWYFT